VVESFVRDAKSDFLREEKIGRDPHMTWGGLRGLDAIFSNPWTLLEESVPPDPTSLGTPNALHEFKHEASQSLPCQVNIIEQRFSDLSALKTTSNDAQGSLMPPPNPLLRTDIDQSAFPLSSITMRCIPQV